MDAILKSQAEHLAREMGTRVTTLDDLNGLMRAMMTTARERMLNTEMDVHLGRRTETTVTDNPTPDAPTTNATERVSAAPKSRRNGHSQKTVSGDLGDLQLRTPRDRNGTFEPQLVATGPRRLDGFDEKILALYAKGLTTRDIQDIVKDLYGVEVSPARVSEITTDLDAEVTAWRTRRLDGVWPIVYLDGIVVHVRGENGRVSPHTMYVAIGVNLQGRKELLVLAGRLGIGLMWLPTQCPELNPVDHLWRELKRLVAANRQFRTIDEEPRYAERWFLGLTAREALRKAGMLAEGCWLSALM
ncbi:mutator family : Transposase, Mutator family OS=Edwardsiella ictaluri (strain 93-146) GN=NT01EI_1510 PE=4 SV=2: Transposase_mut: DDE_3 [Gemmata massiliana]|uniref:Mutator family transposase n=1 Tax=Gemmata massiliana TaxID=1210884 RepID=A0A6P2DKN6_9BACT|nr:transposase [Gemmata massiliana]VTS01041.1 mutator family : Transposase, Mutator family OS=Edwardsiella ictaluri (strain 93-146) GN=NT01EI_1510 PE=4 SV=2: Transposase_mut: DDE_3 [Gemmata massiliana]